MGNKLPKEWVFFGKMPHTEQNPEATNEVH